MLLNVLSSNNNIKKILLFGSRAKGIFKQGSDIDLALKGEELGLADILKLQVKIDELNLPYTVDLVLYDNISDENVKDHIKRVGVTLFDKSG